MELEATILSKENTTFEGKDYSKLNVMTKDGKIGSIRCPLDLNVNEFLLKPGKVQLETAVSQNKIIIKVLSVTK